MPVVTNTVTDPAGQPRAGVQVTIRLVAAQRETRPAPAFVPEDSETILSPVSVVTDEDGVWSADLVANDLIVPAGSYYLISERAVLPTWRETVEYRVSIPDGPGPYWVGDRLIEDPDPVGSPSSVLLHQDDPEGAHAASAVSFASGTFGGVEIAADDVQAAIEEAVTDLAVRPPNTHAASHGDGGVDEVVLDASQIVSGTVADARLPADLARDGDVAAEAAARAAADALLIPLAQRAAANGVATLDGDALIPVMQLPALSISDYLGDVASEAAMLALVGQRGDWATRSDLSATFILRGDDPSVLANWKQLPTPTDAVLSVNGRTGVVTGLAEASDVTTALADKQPLAPDLTAIAELVTTAFGRELLTLVDALALLALLPVDVQFFPSNGTWTKPAFAVALPDSRVWACAVGGSGGAGSGRRGAPGTVRCGGGGTAHGGRSETWFRAGDLGATEPVTVGVAGVGGAAVTVDNTNGNPGTSGGTTVFGSTATSMLRAGGSGGGGGGTNSLGTGGAGPGASLNVIGSGAAASTTGAAGTAGGSASGGTGGAGGGITTGDVASAGGAGGIGAFRQTGGGAAGAAGGGAGGDGAGVAVGVPHLGTGGGGGGSSTTSPGGAGGKGGLYGGGSGGGGASTNGFNSGAGADGQPGCVLVVTHR